jgi:serine/threonine-protein kinase HipA
MPRKLLSSDIVPSLVEERLATWDCAIRTQRVRDHVRNHAAFFRPDLGGWRLAPAFDVVPNPVDTPHRLAMQVALGRFDITHASVLLDARRFGFDDTAHAQRYLTALLDRIKASFDASAALLDTDWARFMRVRVHGNLALLRQS